MTLLALTGSPGPRDAYPARLLLFVAPFSSQFRRAHERCGLYRLIPSSIYIVSDPESDRMRQDIMSLISTKVDVKANK